MDKRFIAIDKDQVVISVRYGQNELTNEIESELGEVGQIMQPDGTFIDPEPAPVEPQTSLEDKINYIYYKQMGVIA